MRPVLLSWGGLGLPAYETALAAGACLLVWWTVRAATRQGLPRRETAVALIAAYAAGLVGARLLFALEVSATPGEAWTVLLHPSSGGFSSLGGLVLGAAVAALVAARLRLPFVRLADSAVVGLCLAAAIGRLGCLLAGCCHGSPTGLPWGVVYPDGSLASRLWGSGVPVHPTPVYEAAALLALAGHLSSFGSAVPRPGRSWGRFVLGYALLRLVTDITRGDVVRYGGLSLVQWLALASLAALLIGAWVGGRETGAQSGMRGHSRVYP